MPTSDDRLWEGHRRWLSHPGGHHGEPVAVAGPPEWLSATLPVVVLVATTVLCGLLLVRPLTGDLSRTARRVVVVASVVATGGGLLVLAVGADRMSVPVLVRLAVTTVAPILLQRRPAALCGGVVLAAAVGMHGSGVTEVLAGLAHVVAASSWLGAAVLVATATAEDRAALVRRLAPWAIGAGLVVAGTGVVRAWSTHVDLATTAGRLVLVKAGVLVAVAVIGVAVHRRPAGRLARFEAAGLAVAVAAGGVLVATAAQPPPVPGAPLLRTVAVGQSSVPLLVVPHRPGPNLVHTTTPGVSVGVDGERMTPAVPRDGADGTWAVVDLPAGRSRLWVGAGDARAAVDLDTGHGESGVDLRGPDGPECASAALGALLAGGTEPLTRCPSDQLAGTDADALRALVGFLAGRGVPEVALIGDDSPRSTAVTEVVRAEAGRHRLAVTTASRPDAPLLVVSGWSAAATALRDTAAGRIPTGGTYLAPWLLAAPVLASGSGVTLPVGFDPYDGAPLRYASAVSGAFPGQAPTAAGYTAWRAGVGREPVRLYAAVRVDVMPGMSGHSGHSGHGWLPGGRLTAVTGPLR
jgi:hypothetical protein